MYLLIQTSGLPLFDKWTGLAVCFCLELSGPVNPYSAFSVCQHWICNHRRNPDRWGRCCFAVPVTLSVTLTHRLFLSPSSVLSLLRSLHPALAHTDMLSPCPRSGCRHAADSLLLTVFTAEVERRSSSNSQLIFILFYGVLLTGIHDTPTHERCWWWIH